MGVDQDALQYGSLMPDLLQLDNESEGPTACGGSAPAQTLQPILSKNTHDRV